jgi:P4 family phage/plasmid primase-like protien
MNKPEFDFAKLNYYFYKGVIDYDSTTKQEYRFNCDVLYDDNQLFWKQNCVKYETVDETKIINGFKKFFSEPTSFLSSVVKGRIIEAYRQYGREKYEQLLQVPGKSVVFQNYLCYLGKDLSQEIDTEKIKDQIVDGNKVVCPHTAFFITNPIPHEYISDEAKIQCPTIDQYFTDWVGEDKKEMLYELIGYCMIPHYPLHRIFLLYGGGRNGKSRFIEILERVVGKDNTTASDIHTLTEDRFGTANLYRKLVCFISETDYHQLERTSILKRLSGEDPINAQFKNKPAFTFRNYAKIIIATNTIPQMQDKTYGNMARYVIIDFPNRFTEDKDILSLIPKEEYTALANICYHRLEKLLYKRKFTGELSAEEKAKFYEEKSNPLGKFLDLFCEPGNGDIAKYEFEERYTSWLRENGYSVNFSKSWLSKEMEDRGYPTVRKTKTIFQKTTNYYYFDNIDIKLQKLKIENVEDKEYTKEEMARYLKDKYNLDENYEADYLIKTYKKAEIIYEPRNEVYKLNQNSTFSSDK